ncbi:MAG: hypothetical protein HY763_07845 [Planctomycetes bacterium]|nr:hypothetical protein [Planctomycetota bacterium]
MLTRLAAGCAALLCLGADGPQTASPEAGSNQESPAADALPSPPGADGASGETPRPFGRPRYLDPRRHRPRHPAGVYDGYRRYYDDAYTYRYGRPYYRESPQYELERAYRQGAADGRNQARFQRQAELGTSAFGRAIGDGHAAFAAGDYGLASRHYLMACSLDQGDPSARLFAAQAHIALGHFEPAIRLVRRAFELQPRLEFLPLDLREGYADPAEFRRHLDTLHSAAVAAQSDAGLWFLVGYCGFYSAEPGLAAEALAHAVRLKPDDRVFQRLSGVAAVAVPSDDRSAGSGAAR